MRNCSVIAIDHHFSYEAEGGVNKMFHSNPNITKGDYEFIRKLSNLNGGSINIYTPFVILVNESGSTLTAIDVIGNSSSSFRFVLPQTILYCTLRDTNNMTKWRPKPKLMSYHHSLRYVTLTQRVRRLITGITFW